MATWRRRAMRRARAAAEVGRPGRRVVGKRRRNNPGGSAARTGRSVWFLWTHAIPTIRRSQRPTKTERRSRDSAGAVRWPGLALRQSQGRAPRRFGSVKQGMLGLANKMRRPLRQAFCPQPALCLHTALGGWVWSQRRSKEQRLMRKWTVCCRAGAKGSAERRPWRLRPPHQRRRRDQGGLCLLGWEAAARRAWRPRNRPRRPRRLARAGCRQSRRQQRGGSAFASMKMGRGSFD